jgi:cation:H+ antiporter
MHYAVPIVLGGLGALFLYKGASLLIDGAAAMARSFGVPLAVIGFTVIAVGTSAPELIVGITAGLQGRSDLVLGNILGSNMVNFGLVLGIGTFLFRSGLPAQNGRLETFALIFALAALYALARDGVLSRVDGGILFALGAVFMWLMVRYHRQTTAGRVIDAGIAVRFRRERILQAVAVAAGVALLYVGARMVVTNAIVLARLFSISELLIGISVVAIGTSLPEIVTTAVASVRNTPDLTVSNALGSNILNIFVVLGLTVLIAPVAVDVSLWRYDLPVLLVTTLAAIALMKRGKLTRFHGVLFFTMYVAYVAFSFFVRGVSA